ncbi:valine--tRNA ligase [Siculibacillus lacustris]|uniref:Valine--tRNA ligase n=1 Tax=Siculibacillus lacustris TaxID=1549641 RepID=A0A4Q9VQB5_9HYPH|nr:valine--tRNA ligase [Siculibacillus lacustris]TBW37982.1 valine--tRNA ligase [Siculibacillus lacustris]
MLEKTYEAAAVEPRISADWDEAGAFRAGAGAAPGAAPYAIVIPPPNVTGSLHMGHALNNTLQDVLVRFERMRGKSVLWQPGTDHAGIATQMVVERQMMQRQEPGRRDIGRAAFLEKVWAWKAESGGTIVNQLKRLGASCDWSRERFTMDEGLSRAVLKVFVDLHRAGLIYRDKRLVNWDPHFETAISDLEVLQVEVKGSYWYFKYPVEGVPGRFVTVATTRPETMLGDTAVAVHPDDERYADLIGKFAILPLVGRRIPIVADDYSDPAKGTGAVKITPAHDFNDFEVGKRHSLPMINILDRKAQITLVANEAFAADIGHGAELAGAPEAAEGEEPIAPVSYVLPLAELETALDGQDRVFARKLVVELMQRRGLLAKIEPNTHAVPHGDRSGVVIEPFLTDQWYVNAYELAQPALAAVREGRTNFVPKNWENTYYQWMENIQPWCVSRQLWWGHQIPAWYGPDGEVFVALSESDALDAAIHHYLTRGDIDAVRAAALRTDGAAGFLTRDEDVLDTWFSSALWPFSTLGWPDSTAELTRYYPTSVLVTGFDIIFFWVARMMMMGLHFMKDEAGDPVVPFKDVYIHALVRDEKGQKMSKSKGNVIDPLELVDEFGADALRFTLAAMAAQGRDIKLAKARVAGYRNFATKLWNAARFAEMNDCTLVPGFDPTTVTGMLNRWITTELSRAVVGVTQALEAYRFDAAAAAAYRFVWNSFCDWYLELAKPIFMGDDEALKAETRATCAATLDGILTLLHPFMPFITEELWAKTAETAGLTRDRLLVLTPWPSAGATENDAAAEIDWLVGLITEIRSVRSEMNVPAAAQIPLVLVGANAVTRARAATHESAILRLARLSEIGFADAAPGASAQIVIGEATACLPLEGVVDVAAERVRLKKEVERLIQEIGRIDKMFANPQFMAKAKEEVIEENRDKREEYVARRAKVEEALARLA